MVGGVVGGVFALAILACCVFYTIHKRQRDQSHMMEPAPAVATVNFATAPPAVYATANYNADYSVPYSAPSPVVGGNNGNNRGVVVSGYGAPYNAPTATNTADYGAPYRPPTGPTAVASPLQR